MIEALERALPCLASPRRADLLGRRRGVEVGTGIVLNRVSGRWAMMRSLSMRMSIEWDGGLSTRISVRLLEFRGDSTERERGRERE